MASPPGIDQNTISQLSKLGAGKSEGEPSSLEDLMMGGLNNLLKFVRVGIPISGLGYVTSALNTSLTTGIDAGLKAGGIAEKTGPTLSVSGATTQLGKIFDAFKRGGTSIKDLTAGIEPQVALNVSWSDLGGLSPNLGGGGGPSMDSGFSMST